MAPQGREIHRRSSVEMAADMLQSTAIMTAVAAIDNCDHCDVIAPLTASGANAWVTQCRLASVAIPGRHKKEFIMEALQDVYNSHDKEFMLVTVQERQCCRHCFQCAYGFDKGVFSAAKCAVVI